MLSQQPIVNSTLARFLEIVETLDTATARAEGGLGVVRIAELVGREKSQVSRALRTLAEAGFVERDPETLRYRVGWRLVALGLRGRDTSLVGAAPPALAELVATTGETAFLAVLAGSDVLTLATESPPHAVVAASWVGRTVPAWCTAAGRTLLADDDPAELERRLGPRFGPAGPNAPRDVADVVRRIAADRERGYAVAEEELEPGHAAVAAPVRDASGGIVAAVIVSGPAFRLSPRLDEAGGAVRRAADAVSRAIASRHAA
jgi:IclR family transcriptional regulator, KDG regulon repressor